MASTVQTGGGSGVDLSELTSGELLFCSFLKAGYIRVNAFHLDGASVDFGYKDAGAKGVDMSKISQISFETGTGGYAYTGNVKWVGGYTKTDTNFSANTPFSISAPTGDNSNSTFTISITGNNIAYVVVKVTSFTTKDGKVHTSSNLNY